MLEIMPAPAFNVIRATAEGSLHGQHHQLYKAALRLRSQHLWPVDGGTLADYTESDARSVHFFAAPCGMLDYPIFMTNGDLVMGMVQYDPETNRLRQLIVDPSYRNHHVGERLVQAVQQEAMETHHRYFLQVNAWVESALFYARQGFIAQGDVYESKGVPCQVMMYTP